MEVGRKIIFGKLKYIFQICNAKINNTIRLKNDWLIDWKNGIEMNSVNDGTFKVTKQFVFPLST